MEISTEAIKTLRQLTGVGIMDCKRALQDAQGNIEKAQDLLSQRGAILAAKRALRETKEGVIEAYVHSGSRLGAMIELNCESDFVSRTPDFRELAHNIAMQVAAMAPKYITKEDIPSSDHLNPEEVCLLYQPFIKDPSKSIQDLINDAVAKIGEKIQVKRFIRFSLGE